MQRYFVSKEQIQDGKIMIGGEDARHITRVMRMEPGDEVICCDGQGQSWRVRLEELHADRIIGTMVRELQEQREAGVKITLVQSLPKGDKMDWIIQKGTEVGIASFQPVETKRTIVEYDAKKEAKRRERWQRIAKEAAEQAQRTCLPAVAPCQPFSEWLSQVQNYDLVCMPYEGEREKSLHSILFRYPTIHTMAVIIGPEGGFAPEEVEAAWAAGVHTISLGPRILRTETAGLVTAAAILYHYGELGGENE